ncbi:MAG: hypothetical protein GX410_04485 [Elusimicrobia bacterium]|nr:hypothetical protein [Elusimicrobiota bacterium]
MPSKHFSVFLFITLLLNSSGAFSSPRNAQEEFAYALLHARSAWDIGYGDKTREIFRALPQDEKNKFLPYVCSALKSEDKEVRENGIHACSYIGPVATSCLSDALEMKYIELTDLSWNLPKMGMLTPVIEKAIVEFIHSPESDRRVGLLETFGECRYSSKDVATALKEKLAHFKDKQRLPYLICGLAKLGEVETVRPIIKKLIREGDRQSLYCISGNDIKANIFAKDIANSTKITLEEKIQVLMTIEAERDVLLPLIMQGIKSEGAARVVAANAVVKFGFLNNELLSNACTWAKLVNRYDYKPFLSFSSFNSVNAKKLFAALNKCEVPVTGWNNRDWIDAALLEMVPNLKDEIYVLLNSDSVHCPAVIKAVALSGPRAAKPLVEIMRQAAGVGGQREEIARTIASMGPDAAPAIPELSELFTCSDSNIYIPAAWILGAIGSESLPVLHRMEGNSLYADRLIAAISFMPPSPEAFAMLSRLVASTKDVEILKQSANVLKTWNSYC